MGVFNRKSNDAIVDITGGSEKADESGLTTPQHHDDAEKGNLDNSPVTVLRLRILAMALIVSVGGVVFGYDTGQISGFLEMPDFIDRFGSNGAFTNARSGSITGLLSIGSLLGALLSAPIADIFGRKICVIVWNVVFVCGVIIQIASVTSWVQLMMGRWLAGFGVGGLSVLTPMYQSETAPRQIRGALVSCYQLSITFGIFLADAINLGTHTIDGSASWRITMGIGFLFPLLMGTGILFLRESPRWDYRHGRIDRARTTIALSYGVSENHWEVHREMEEIREKFEAENAGGGKHKFYEVFTGPRMFYRTCLGMTLQMLQQLTGANYFFYYGTSVFAGVGISDSYVTALILGAINFGMTIPGLFVVERFGRRQALISGGLWMFLCFMIFASVGHFLFQQGIETYTAGIVMIVFAALFIAGYAMTWAPIVWAVIGEMFPTRYRAQAMGLSSSSNWLWNFLIAFFTPFITADIDFRYGYVFAACCFTGSFVVYFFLCEAKGRTLEEIDTMYITHVKPWQSSKWEPPEGEDLITADALYLTPGARDIRKANAAGMESGQKVEDVPPATKSHGIHDVSGTGHEIEAAGVRGNSIA
ncbi:hypothetical protein EJ03DRAFT_330105 [Teratosphaeria nubilosa]|uniref:Major facilitator superfamily (MFS) profile domain-containing protein n=1 Tax=Teratosphaeria nubilosa TaxID=161662 RepID=A0A6G1L2A5_9PEZI|nr:hypothetical protein EJ03DRAFT_330105 [Teratosphaeria nubilosa]